MRFLKSGLIGGLVLTLGLVGCGNGGVGGGSEVAQLPEQPGAVELGTQAQLGGQFIREISLQSSGTQASGPQQVILLTFAATGLDQARQFLITLELTPQSLFDLENSFFEPVALFISPPGFTIEVIDDQVRTGAAILAREGISGAQNLGTLTLKTASGFNALSRATVRIVALSIGPSSSERDNFEAADLQMGVAVGGP